MDHLPEASRPYLTFDDQDHSRIKHYRFRAQAIDLIGEDNLFSLEEVRLKVIPFHYLVNWTKALRKVVARLRRYEPDFKLPNPFHNLPSPPHSACPICTQSKIAQNNRVAGKPDQSTPCQPEAKSMIQIPKLPHTVRRDHSFETFGLAISRLSVVGRFDGQVALIITKPQGSPVEFTLSPDQAEDLIDIIRDQAEQARKHLKNQTPQSGEK